MKILLSLFVINLNTKKYFVHCLNTDLCRFDIFNRFAIQLHRAKSAFTSTYKQISEKDCLQDCHEIRLKRDKFISVIVCIGVYMTATCMRRYEELHKKP